MLYYALLFLFSPVMLLAEEASPRIIELPEEGYKVYTNENGFRHIGGESHKNVEFTKTLRDTDKDISDFLWRSPDQGIPSLVMRPFINPKILGKDFQTILSDGYLDNVVLEVNLEMAASSERYFYSKAKLGNWEGGEYPIVTDDLNGLESYWYKAFKTSDPEIFVVLMGEYSGGTQNWYDSGIVKISKKNIIKAPYDKKPLEYKDTFVMSSLAKLPIDSFGNKKAVDFYLEGIGIELIEWFEK